MYSLNEIVISFCVKIFKFLLEILTFLGVREVCY